MLMHQALAIDYEDLQSIADPHGIAYDPRTDTLFVADTASGTLLRIVNGQPQRLATIGSGGAIGISRLGGLVLTPDGTMFVTRLGHGHAGAVFAVDRGGRATALAKLPPELWRFGIAYDATEHALYTTQFLMSKFGAHEGSVVTIDLRTGEPSTVIDGFHQPTGIAKLGKTLVVADARMRAVFRIELVAGRAVSRHQLLTTSDRPDSLCPCGDDSVLVTGYDAASKLGTVQRLWLDGRLQLIASGVWQPRGVVTDGTRAYVAARGGERIMVFDL